MKGEKRLSDWGKEVRKQEKEIGVLTNVRVRSTIAGYHLESSFSVWAIGENYEIDLRDFPVGQ